MTLLARLEARAPWVAGVAAFVAFWATRAMSPTEWDSVQLVLGLDRFDVRQDSPHAPGYWGYVAVGRLIRAVTPFDGTTALTLASALAAASTVGLVVVVGRDLAGRWLGFAAAATVATIPFFWFYGSTIASYAFEALASTVLMLLAWRARPGGRHGAVAAVVLGLAGGFRPTALIVLFPLAFVAALRANRGVRAWSVSAAAGALAVAAWLVPMTLEQPGGLREIMHNNDVFWDNAASRTSVFSDGSQAAQNFKTLTAHMVAALGLVAALGVVALAVGVRRSNRDDVARAASRFTPVELLLAATLPPFAFMALFHFGKSGYLLSLLPAAVLLALWPVARLRSRWRVAGSVAVVLIAAFGAQQFLFRAGALPSALVDEGPWFTRRANSAPFGGTRDVIRAADRYQAVFDEIRARFDPDSDVLVYVSGNGAHWYRHAMEALPEFTIHLNDTRDARTGRGDQYEREEDGAIEVPPGGQALVAVDLPTAELADMQRRGVAEAIHLDAGAAVWRVPPGETVNGVRIVEVEGALDRPLTIRSPES